MRRFATLLILVAAVWLGFATNGLPGVVSATAPDSAFSADRALHDLQFITATAHPTGTVAHDRVRDYLVDRLRALGLAEVHVQSATGFNTLDGPLAATVANVVARKRGTQPGPAILLLAHYDAVPRSFGAGDDGAGVAAILETVRALQSSAPLTHDLMIVFSDAEEDGLLGAEAFVNLHPWAKDVAVVLNFEGRGDQGPVYMFQTSPGNAPLVKALAASVRDARTNSLTGGVYRHLPSDTDLSIWLHSGFAVGALNFAHVGGYTHYHTPIDNLASLDLRIVQQMGDYALGMVKQLGRANLGAMRTSDLVYFNAPLVGVVHYPSSWAVPLGIVGLVLTIVVIVIGVKQSPLSSADIRRGTATLALTLAVPAIVAAIGWRVVMWLHPSYRDILQGDPYNARWYLLCFVAFTVAFAVSLQRRLEVTTTRELAVAPLLLWGVMGIVVAIMLPGASYLFIWPLLGAAVGLLFAPAVFALPVLVLWPPLIVSFESALTAQKMPLFVLMAALVMSLLVVPLAQTGDLRRWIVRAAMAVGVIALIVAEAMSGPSATRRHPDSLARLIDADSAKAWWVSYDRTSDAWTSYALGPQAVRRRFDDVHLTSRGSALLTSSPEIEAPPPSAVRVLEASNSADGERVHLHVDQRGAGEAVMLFLDSAAAASHLTLNGRELADGAGDRYSPQYHMGRNGAVLRYFGVPEEGIDLWFTVHAAGPVNLHVVTAVEGLPGPLPPRPANLMSKPFVLTDMTITRETVSLVADVRFAGVQERGRAVMGVDQYTSAHVFEDLPDGGRIVLDRNSASDQAGIATVRQHMRDIAIAFRAGDFDRPFQVHAQVVPGTDVMATKHDRITYSVVDRPRGAEVRIRTGDPGAIAAVHAFLAFQRQDHRAAGHEHIHQMP